MSFALLFSGALPLSSAQETYFAELGGFDYLSTFGLVLVTMVAAIQLFRLRKTSVPLFGVVLALSLGLAVLQIMTTNFTEAMPAAGLFGYALGLAVPASIFSYARKLRQRGLLV